MTKTELPGTPPARPLAPAARGNETLPVSVRPQRSPAGTPAAALGILLQGLRHLPWPRGGGWSAGAASAPAAVPPGPGLRLCIPGAAGGATGTHPLQVGAGGHRAASPGQDGTGEGGSEFTEHYKPRCQCQPQALPGRVKPPQATAREGSPGPAPRAPPCLLWAGSVAPIHCREGSVSPTTAFLPPPWAEGRAVGSHVLPSATQPPSDTPEPPTWGLHTERWQSAVSHRGGVLKLLNLPPSLYRPLKLID